MYIDQQFRNTKYRTKSSLTIETKFLNIKILNEAQREKKHIEMISRAYIYLSFEFEVIESRFTNLTHNSGGDITVINCILKINNN